MRIIIQKFGGTSLNTPELRQAAARHILDAIRDGYWPVVVVSAMGRAGEPYATDTLIQLASAIYPDTPSRELDLLLSCGEIISAVLFSNTLRASGAPPPVVLTGGQAGIITDRRFGDARILRVEPDHLNRHLERGDLCVVAGFQGVAETGDITTLGRGGSDTTAAALGVALRAEVIEIYTDVDGVKTADPALVEDARTLRVLTYEEALHMALEGARVIHPRAVDLAMRGNVPIRVRPTRGDGPGTLICHSYESSRRWLDGHGRHAVTSVAQAGGVAQVIVHTEPSANGRADLEIFQLLAQEGIGVDMVNVLPDRKAFAVREEDAERARKLLEGKGYGVSVRTSCAKVSLVGAGLDGRTGVMAQVVQVLHRSGVPILQTADSRTTISCLVPREALPTAVRALHAHFGLGDGKGLVQ